ncbi:OstA-like protein [Plebeiibacterium sediminum]|uniref:Organic solvent tolerance protein OstA n=1 Tax=Plebeiibacterium sediminum TaxID=2992112 RepID=A0AAE3SFC3_9BACT|nr:OstA-like protein [Plebeiobacterium sediminum]MCW3786033.1 organic solvent tolerance protein OstA [Plebeiobacterium sediminum]
MRTYKSIFTIFICLFFGSFYITAQKKINVKHADFLKGNKVVYGEDINVLVGNVKFTHETATMFCDTAFLNKKENKLKAVGNIHIIQNDTLHLYGRRLNYDGNTGLAEVREDVKLVNKDIVLTTDYLDFDRKNNFAYYFNNGKIVNKDNTLTSKSGYYYPDSDMAFYKDSVVVNNPKYTMFSDTLKYHTITKVATIEGPTFIVSEKNTIYAESGFYDTQNDVALLKDNAYVDGEQLLKGDSIHYDRKKGIGEVFNSMELHDTTNNVIITGDYGFYNEISQDALTTKNAVLMQIYNADTLFLHADTLVAVPLENPNEKLIKAYRKVQYYRSDLQGRCDSMVFDSRDTTNTFYHDPIMWSLGNQLTSDEIKMYTKDEVLDKVDLIDRAFIISEEDTGRYNQIKGSSMTGFIKNNEIYKIDVNGNAQSIYYPMDKKDAIGVNKAECSNMIIYLKQRMVSKINMQVSPTGKMSPILLVPDEELRLAGFYWLDMFRPKQKEDIFNWKELPKIDRGEDKSEYNLDNTYEDYKNQ